MSADDPRAQVGDTPVLSDREMEIIRLVATGATNQQIARALTISPNTVKVHLRNVFEKLGVESRTEATMVAVRQGWVVIHGGQVAPAIQPARPLELEITPVAEVASPPVPAPPPPPEMPALAPVLAPSSQRAVLLVAALLALLIGLMPTLARVGGTGENMAPPLPRVLSDRNLPPVAASTLMDSARWQARAPLPSPRDRLAVAAVDNKVYALGGENSQGTLADTLVFDPATNGWLPKTSKPTAVSNAAAAVLGGKIYVPGALAGGHLTDQVEVYDPAADTWSQGTPLPAPRAAYALAVMNNSLFLCGGWDGQRATNTAWRYDVGADHWTPLAPLPAALTLAAAAGLQGRQQILLAGGGDADRAGDQVFLYDTSANAWSKGPAMGAARAGLALVALGPSVYALGGQGDEAQSFSERYDPSANAWTRLDAPLTGEWRNLAAAAVGQRIYAVGGWGGQYLATTLELQSTFPFRQVLPAAGKNS